MTIKRPLFHITPVRGWINDPNGFCFKDGLYHLYAQHYPYKPEWGPMHWLHFVSNDGVRFQEDGIALKPTEPYELPWGCFSGSSIVVDGTIYSYYTGAQEGRQVQCLAKSKDGSNFEKFPQNPVIDPDILPSRYSRKEFRDPKAFIRDGSIYILAGCRCLDNGSSILLFKSNDGERFEFVSEFYHSDLTGEGIMECPDIIFPFEGKDDAYLIFSPQFRKSADPYRFQNIHSSVYVYGHANLGSGRFEPVGEETELDHGFDFYAAQTLSNGNEFLLTAFEAMWERNYPTAKDGYAGSLVLPRRLSFMPPLLKQSFPDGLKKYKTGHAEYGAVACHDGIKKIDLPTGDCKRIKFVADTSSDWSFVLDGGFSVSYSKDRSLLKVERKGMEEEIYSKDGTKEDTRYIEVRPSSELRFDILVDGYLIDMLIDDGLYAFSSQFYGSGESSICFLGKLSVEGLSLETYGGETL